MSDLVGLLADIRKAGHQSAAHLISSNSELAILPSENNVCIAAHLILSNTVLATLAS